MLLKLFERPGLTWLVDTKYADPRQVFRIENDTLAVSGDGFGYWRTAEAFDDFRLVVDFKWDRQLRRQNRALDSGIFIHTQGPDGNSHDGSGAFMAGLEVNLFQGATGDLLLIRGDDESGGVIRPWLTAEVSSQRDPEGWFTWQRGGNALSFRTVGRLNWMRKSPQWRDIEDFRGEDDVENPRGQWNHLEIESDGGRLRVWLNERLVNEALRTWPRRGHIAFQCEGAEIWFLEARLNALTK
ncbi:MAG: 3-keto-disaccharide hydrolase [Verrucomicrobiales bacterium]